MDVEALISRKMEQRRAAGLHFRIKFENNSRCDFNYYASNKADFDEQLSRARASVGKRDRSGHTAVSVEVVPE